MHAYRRRHRVLLTSPRLKSFLLADPRIGRMLAIQSLGHLGYRLPLSPVHEFHATCSLADRPLIMAAALHDSWTVS